MTIAFRRYFARANHWTFQIGPIKELLKEYVGDGKNWIDPFAGMNSPAEFRNDHNPRMNAQWHLEAEHFCLGMAEGALGYNPSSENGPFIYPPPPFDGVIFDPPYSYRQVSEHYQMMGMKASQRDTSYNFYGRVMNAIAPAIKSGGLAISFGWNSNGFGKGRQFEIIDGIIIAHGLHHNDTIVTVERKL